MKKYVPPGKINAIAKEKAVKVQIKTPTTEDPRFSKLSNVELAKVVKQTKQRLIKLQKDMEHDNIKPEFVRRETLEEYKMNSICNEATRFPELKKRIERSGAQSISQFIDVHSDWVKCYENKHYDNHEYYDDRENDSYEYSLEAGGL